MIQTYQGDLFTGPIVRAPELRVFLADDEVAADGFAGGGGTSTGIEWAIGRPPDLAINHNAEALAMHCANHPETEHILSDIREVSPAKALRGRRCGFLWLSPDCTFFSKAKGGAPFRDREQARKIRGLITIALRWADLPGWQKPRVIFIENVEEIEDWCPIGDDGRPDFSRRGASFRRFIAALRSKGFTRIEWRQLRGMDFGAPTTRKRLYIIARSDDQPIVWPEPTHGPGLEPYRAVAECIDFDLPVPSIFLTPAEAKAWGKAHGVSAPKRPLATATLRRVARGVGRYVLDAADPFIINVRHQGGDRSYPLTDPLRTIPASDREYALVAPTLINTRNGERSGQAPRIMDIRAPWGTVTAHGSQGAVVAAFLAKHNGGNEATGQRLIAPADTITTRDQKALVAAHLLRFNGEKSEGSVRAQLVVDPISTLDTSNRFAAVYAFLIKYYGSERDGHSIRGPIGTIVTKDRFALVTVSIAGEQYILVDIGMRMLTPRELFRAQGFPGDYRIDYGLDPLTGERVTFTKKTQTRLVGNSVVPHVAAAIVSANMRELPWRFQRAA